MTLAWILYADDYNGKIVGGNTHRDPDVEYSWVYWESSDVIDERIQGIKDGYLFPYCKDIKLYKCPTGIRGEVATYAIVDPMNGHREIDGATLEPFKRRSQIRYTSKQIVFLDEGRLSPSSWTVYYKQERWWDKITCRHGDGTNFGFADCREHWKWSDPRTIKLGRFLPDETIDPGIHHERWSTGNQDLHRVQRGIWGRLGY